MLRPLPPEPIFPLSPLYSLSIGGFCSRRHAREHTERTQDDPSNQNGGASTSDRTECFVFVAVFLRTWPKFRVRVSRGCMTPRTCVWRSTVYIGPSWMRSTLPSGKIRARAIGITRIQRRGVGFGRQTGGNDRNCEIRALDHRSVRPRQCGQRRGRAIWLIRKHGFQGRKPDRNHLDRALGLGQFGQDLAGQKAEAALLSLDPTA